MYWLKNNGARLWAMGEIKILNKLNDGKLWIEIISPKCLVFNRRNKMILN
jgi:hypothetical protein